MERALGVWWGFLGYNCGRGGVSLDYGSVKSHVLSWQRSLVARGNDPDTVEPGHILLGKAFDAEAAYLFIKWYAPEDGPSTEGLHGQHRDKAKHEKHAENIKDIDTANSSTGEAKYSECAGFSRSYTAVASRRYY